MADIAHREPFLFSKPIDCLLMNYHLMKCCSTSLVTCPDFIILGRNHLIRKPNCELFSYLIHVWLKVQTAQTAPLASLPRRLVLRVVPQTA